MDTARTAASTPPPAPGVTRRRGGRGLARARVAPGVLLLAVVLLASACGPRSSPADAPLVADVSELPPAPTVAQPGPDAPTAPMAPGAAPVTPVPYEPDPVTSLPPVPATPYEGDSVASLPPVPTAPAPVEPAPAPTPVREFTAEELTVPATEPIATEEDARAVYDRLVVAVAALSTNPDPALVDDVYTQSCPCYRDFYEHIAGMARDGHRSTGVIGEVIDFSATRVADERWRTRAVRQSADGGGLVDAAGNVVEAYPPREPQVIYTEIVRDEGLWKFSEVRTPPEEPTPWASPAEPAS